MNIKKMQGNESVNSHQLNQPNCRAQPQIKFKVKRVMKNNNRSNGRWQKKIRGNQVETS
jgi:hypothetical protein